ncbi:MAG: ribonuclease III [Synergistaceae bacterium]|nr:ribonuclease III [Synergistaceae bacterium]
MKDKREREASLCTFQKKLGYTFRKIEFLEEALTHSSYANESGLSLHNERLEFLGDAVLELITSERLYREYKTLDEGQLTRLRSRFVCKNSLGIWAGGVGIPDIIKLGRSLLKSGATQSVAADAAEAVFGAVFLDGGYGSALTVVDRFLDSQEVEASPDALDPKTELQELLQGQGRGVPYYKTIERSGPDHALHFKVQVTLGDAILAEAWGSSIKEAEFSAAELALKSL